MLSFIKYLLLSSLLIISSCTDTKIVKDKDKFASLYIDLQLNLEKNRGDLDKIKSGKAKIYKKYCLTEGQYEATIADLEQDTSKWNRFFEKVSSRLGKMRKTI